jgi:hypothetical protein
MRHSVKRDHVSLQLMTMERVRMTRIGKAQSLQN